MSAIQSSQNNTTFPFLQGNIPANSLDNETIAQDAARTVILYQYTVMAYIAATKKWVPWTSVTAVDGSALPMGILLNDGGIAAADLAAGDVTGAQILVTGSGLRIDANQIVFDLGSTGAGPALTLDTVINPSNATSLYAIMTAQRFLESRGFVIQSTVNLDKAEN